jgi:flagellar M-ring protein FliF
MESPKPSSSSTSVGSLAVLAPLVATSSRVAQRLRELPGRTRLMFAGVAAAALVGAGIFFTIVAQPSWRVLYADLDPSDARELADQLTAAKIPFDIAANGGTIKVPADQLDKARLETAAKGGPRSGRMGFELFDKPNWVGSEFDEQVNYQRALEGELEHTIASLGSVKTAHVHLVLPHDSLFTEQQQEAKASVLLKLKRKQLDPQEAEAIRNLVANSVDRLSAANVVLVDADGRTQFAARTASGAAADEEQRLADRLVATLEPITGPGNVRASVSLEYDPSAADETEETYDPNGTVTLTMQRSEQESGEAPQRGGVPGTVSNAPNAQPPLLPPPRSASNASVKEESGTYGASKKTRHVVEGPGRLKRLTVALLLNDRGQPTAGHGAAVRVPWTPEQMKRITGLAQAAVGYQAARGDLVSVENISFDASPDAAGSATERLVSEASRLDLPRYGAALLGLLALIFLVMRPVSRNLAAVPAELPAPGALFAATDEATAPGAAALFTPEVRQLRESVLERVSASVAADPAQSARLLQMWLETE